MFLFQLVRSEGGGAGLSVPEAWWVPLLHLPSVLEEAAKGHFTSLSCDINIVRVGTREQMF